MPASLRALGITLALTAAALQPASAQDGKVWLGWSPKPDVLTPYGSNRPRVQLADVLVRHRGQARWSEDVIETERYDAKWIQMAPGDRTRPRFYSDDRVIWVVWEGQIRFDIQGQQPFVASKGFVVEVPMRTTYSMATVGDKAALRFEVRPGGKLPSYPTAAGDRRPANIKGYHYVRAQYPGNLPAGGPGSYDDKNRPFLDFYTDFVAKYGDRRTPTSFFVSDEENQAAVIRGPGVPTPPPSNKGHFHVGNEEFWFILEGKIDYLIEGEGLFTAEAGDVVLAAPGRWHRASFAPGQMDTRLAFNRSPTMLHNYAEDAGGAQ
jgi:mannose-6-phosphate isomerase-like protein (cupin superfamily)